MRLKLQDKRHFHLERLENRDLLAAHLLQDINTQTEDIRPRYVTPVGDRVFFSARKGLWVSDGTTVGTQLVDETVLPRRFKLAALGDKLVYTRFDFDHGVELWVTDGTTHGTRLIKDINPGPEDLEVWTSMVANADSVVFGVRERDLQGSSSSLWKTNGTADGTVRIANVPGNIQYLQHFKGQVYFSLLDEQNRYQLWKTDGSNAGTEKVADFEGRIGFVETTSSHIFMNVSGAQFWSTDGTTAGTAKLEDARVSNFAMWNNQFVYLVQKGEVATLRVFDETANSSSHLFEFDTANVKLFPASNDWMFVSLAPKPANTGVAAALSSDQVANLVIIPFRELWALNPNSLAPLQKLSGPWKDGLVRSGATGTVSEYSSIVNQFGPSTAEPPQGVELRSLDGTSNELVDLSDVVVVDGQGFYLPANTVSLETPIPNPMAFTRDSMTQNRSGVPGFQKTEHGNIFVAADSLWKTDGTESGTVQLKAWENQRFPVLLTSPFRGRAFFRVDVGSNSGGPLWMTDGTAEGTVQISELKFETVLERTDDAIYFGRRYEIWKLDANLELTLVADLLAASRADSSLRRYPDFHAGMVDDNLVVLSRLDVDCDQDCESYLEIHTYDTKSADPDATAELVSRIGPHPGQESQPLIRWGDSLAFVAGDLEHGQEMWTTDGTNAGTQLAFDMTPGEASSNVKAYWRFRDKLIIETGVERENSTLISTDGTADGTHVLVEDVFESFFYDRELIALDDRIVFVAEKDRSGYRVWVSDGTSEGTEQLGLYAAKHPVESSAFLKEHQGQVLFAAYTAEDNRTNLWVTDGTTTNTRLLKSADSPIRPTSLSFFNAHKRRFGQFVGPQRNPTENAVLGDEFFFVAESEQLGREIWRTDGTDAGTQPVVDVARGQLGSNPQNLTVIDGDLYFSADGDQGQEPWIYTEEDIPLPGDTNGDHAVTFADFLILSANFGKIDAVLADGDFYADGNVDSDDYKILAANMGQRRVRTANIVP